MSRAAGKYLVVKVGDWVRDYRYVNVLLKAGVQVLWAQTSLQGKTVSGKLQTFPPGTFVVDLSSEHSLARNRSLISPAQAVEEAKKRGVSSVVVGGDVKGELAHLRSARVALYGDGGSPYPFADILSSVGIESGSVTAVDIRNGELENYDVFVIPGGGNGGPAIQGALLGEEGRRAVKEFVHQGGGMWGSCAGCCNLVHMREETLKSWEALFKDWPRMQSLEVINTEYWSVGMPGVGKLLVKNADPAHPVMFGLPEQFELTWHLGPFLSPRDKRMIEASTATPLVQLKGFTKDWTSAEYVFSQSKQSQPGALEKTYAGRGIAEQRYGVAVGYYGLGKVCASGAHPEFGLDWLLEKWGTPARMFANFVLWSASGSPGAGHEGRAVAPPKAASTNTATMAHKTVEERCARLKAQATKLLAKTKGPTPHWLSEEKAEASFGLSGQQKWKTIVRRLCKLPSEVQAASAAVLERRLALGEVLERCGEAERSLYDGPTLGTVRSVAKMAESQLAGANDDYFYERPPEWNQDYGWNGALALLDSALKAVEYSLKNYNNPDVTSDNSPYHAIWAWYLGGLYDALNASIVLKSRERSLEDSLAISGLALKGSMAEPPRPVSRRARR